MTAAKNVVLDFDGTCTDTFQESVPYEERFPQLFSERFNIPRIALDALIARYSVEVGKDPASGWIYGGNVVAPAGVDPYVFNTAVFNRVYEHLFGTEGRDAALYEIHTESYKHTGTAFRPGVAAFLRALPEQTVIVTNSAPDAVESKMRILRAQEQDIPPLCVVGNAKKYAIDNTWTDIEAAMQPPGFPRPVLLRRKKYAEALRDLGFAPADTAVVGDVYELDLALPEHLGYRTIQLRTEGTPAWEQGYRAQGRSIATSYDEILSQLD